MSSNIYLTYVSHACVRIDGPFGALLCDPWILDEPVYNFTTWKYPEPTLSPDKVLEGVTHVYISHSHEDHFHVPSLDHIPRDVTLILPEYSWRPGLRAQTIERTMRRMGFYDILKPLPWEEIELDAETRLTIVPAAASKPQDWENSALVFDHPEARILNVNDCPSDEALYETLRAKFDRFDLALLQYAGVSMYPGRFLMSKEAMREAVRKKRASFIEQKRALDMLTIDSVIPFAGDFCWLDDELFHCNWACRSTPHLFEEWHAKTYPDSGRPIHILYPGDKWRPDGVVERHHPPVNWDTYLNDLEAVQARKRNKINAINDWLAASPRDALVERTRQYLDTMARHILRNGVVFTAVISFKVARDDGGEPLALTFSASPEAGFSARMGADPDADHTCHLSEAQWASVLAGKLMINTLHWTSEIEQREPFNPDVGKFWWWLESNGDLNNRGPQVLLEMRQFPDEVLRTDPQLGVIKPKA